VQIDGRDVTVEVRETDDGFEAEIAETTFEDYLREKVFTLGQYVYSNSCRRADIAVAENDDASGYVCPIDLNGAIADKNVGVHEIDDGWLGLRDRR
jgi:hypothetical protein